MRLVAELLLPMGSKGQRQGRPSFPRAASMSPSVSTWSAHPEILVAGAAVAVDLEAQVEAAVALEVQTVAATGPMRTTVGPTRATVQTSPTAATATGNH